MKPQPINVQKIVKTAGVERAYLHNQEVRRYENLIKAIRAHVMIGASLEKELQESESYLELLESRAIAPEEASKLMDDIYQRCLNILNQ